MGSSIGKFEYLDYNYFNKATLIELGGSKYSLYYGVDKQRIKSIDSIPQRKTVRYYFGSYEKEIINDTATHIDYIFAPSGLALIVKTHIATTAVGKGVGGIGDGIAITQPGIPSGYDFYYVNTDNLGSIALITNPSKAVISKYYYQPFGGRVLLTGTDITPRGYTFHEHLTLFGLINMNGRFYDPVLARFLSPDPYVQMPDFTQNYNRYSYALNNPFKFTDPSGEVFVIDDIIVGAMIGAFVNIVVQGLSGKAQTPADFFTAGIAGAFVGGVGGILGSLVSGIQVSGIIPGALVHGALNAAIGAGTGVLLNGLNNTNYGDGFWDNAGSAATMGAIVGGLFGMIDGGIRGLKLAEAKSVNNWWGSEIKYGRTKWSFFTSEKPYATLRWHLKNVGFSDGNNCVPTTLTELEQYYCGDRSYEYFKTKSGYIDGKGVESYISEVGNPIKNNFNTTTFTPENLLDYKQALETMEGGGIISTNMPYRNIRHADNIRSIKYYSKNIVLKTRLTSFNLSTAIESSKLTPEMQFYFYLIFGIK